MVSNVSFTGIYNVSTRNNKYPEFSKFQEFAMDKTEQRNVRLSYQEQYADSWQAAYTLTTPDKMDNEVESFCLANGINFKKTSIKDVTSPSAIEKRIETPKEGYSLVKVNAKKLEEFVENQISNIPHCKESYENYYKKTTQGMIESEDSLPASTLYIHSFEKHNKDLMEYIDRFGAENLNTDSVFVDFGQKTNTPDHCMYFALKNLGMNEIPVYVDADTKKAAEALGLLD